MYSFKLIKLYFIHDHALKNLFKKSVFSGLWKEIFQTCALF